jgi:hypothetical protein
MRCGGEIAERKAAFGTWRCARERLRDKQVAREREWEAECAERKFRSNVAWLRFKLAFEQLRLKAGFNPDQPRDELGRWSDGGGINDSRVVSDAIPDNDWRRGAQYAANNERPPPPMGHNKPPSDIPKERPPTARERNAIATRAARSSGRLGAILAIGTWLYELYPSIKSYRDPPKTLQELQEAVSSPQSGYDKHHVVERTSAAQDGFSKSDIDGPGNLVLVPRMKHWEINGWYSTRNEDFGGLTPRDYLRGKSWDERQRIGLDALEKFGVLKR